MRPAYLFLGDLNRMKLLHLLKRTILHFKVQCIHSKIVHSSVNQLGSKVFTDLKGTLEYDLVHYK